VRCDTTEVLADARRVMCERESCKAKASEGEGVVARWTEG
jgi:hypothetical protein